MTGCSNTGDIGENCGGIFTTTNRDYHNVIKIKVDNCYNTGQIMLISSGGIFGPVKNLTSIDISNCYNAGKILNGGGIFASFGDFHADISINIVNCYNIGNIYGTNSRGISGDVIFKTKINLFNCYNAGVILSYGGAAMFGKVTRLDLLTFTNCYILQGPTIDGDANTPTGVTVQSDSIWTDNDAYTALDNRNNVWQSFSPNTPFLLATYTEQFYSKSDVCNQIKSIYGGYLDSDFKFAIIDPLYDATIDEENGQITLKTLNVAVNDKYDIKVCRYKKIVDVLSKIIIIDYNFNTFTFYTVGTIIKTDTTINDNYLSTNTGPYYLLKDDEESLVITIGETITITNKDQYFVINSSKIEFIGETDTVINFNCIDYPGLISDGYYKQSVDTTVSIDNIKTSAALDASLINGGGWICQSDFTNQNAQSTQTVNVSNCVNTGSINSLDCGGIFGSEAGYDKEAFYYDAKTIINVNNCSNTGNMDNTSCGGIFGYRAGDENIFNVYITTITLNNCYNTGSMNYTNCGGIFGPSAGANITVNNCYNTGSMLMEKCGGIFGPNVGKFFDPNAFYNITLKNCFNAGNMMTDCGGIFGYDATGTNSTITLNDCYNTGDMSNTCGGLFGKDTNVTNVLVTNCYNTGNMIENCGGLFAENPSNTISITSCYNSGNIGNTDKNNGSMFNNKNNATLTFNKCYILQMPTISSQITDPEGVTVQSGAWNDSSAYKALTAYNTLPSDFYYSISYEWVSLSFNTPFLLGSFKASIYNPDLTTTDLQSGKGITPPSKFKLIGVNNKSEPENITFDTYDGNITITMIPDIPQYVCNVARYNYPSAAYQYSKPSSDNKYYQYDFNTFTFNVPNKTEITISKEITQNFLNSNLGPYYIIKPQNNFNDELIITFDNITITDANQYFIIERYNVTFEGSHNIIHINLTETNTSYPGLIQNGTDTSEINTGNVTINNINITSTSKLDEGGGWIGQSYFGKNALGNIYVNNCSTSADIPSNCGGFFGEYAGSKTFSSSEINVNFTLTNCSNTGNMSTNCGGFFAPNHGFVTNLHSNNLKFSIINSYNTGNMNDGCGGFFGKSEQTDESLLYELKNCFNIGNMSNNCGGFFGINKSNVTFEKCYNTGNMTENCGGFVVDIQANPPISFDSCYNSGSIGTNNSGGFIGSISDESGITFTSCYCTKSPAIVNVNDPIGVKIYEIYSL